MTHAILLVDEQRDILRLLHAALDTLKIADLVILEAPSGEEALLEATRRPIDLLVTDYRLPGITGVELMHKIRARHPEVSVILITGTTDRKIRTEMLNAGAMAIFDKPIPQADFLDVVERALGLVRAIYPSETSSDAKRVAPHARLSDLLANFRQDINAQAVFLLNDRGLVLARAGDLRDSSMEASLLSSLVAIHSAGVQVSHDIHQETLDAYYAFRGGDHDLLFTPVTPMYALLVAGNDLASAERILETVQSMLAFHDEVEKALKSMGVTGELASPAQPALSRSPAKSPEGEPVEGDADSQPASTSSPGKKGKTQELPAAPPAPEMEALFKEGKKKVKMDEVDSFWDEAAEKHKDRPTSPNVITYEQARQLGLAPDQDKR